ncbi:MAG: class I SAM-dependent methyltransferase [Alphaproteobacteria bacterium]|nr:class I SAM-dependent methyltransferase [Alphaproteobacteria bacterium]MCB9797909.1 class I SAM-dependent methyltransferase [Alphaproteobacteria bacterium]
MSRELHERYFVELAAAFVRGHRPDAPALEPAELVAWGREQGLRLHKFKRNAELPRVRRVLGALRGLGPAELLDIGSGRGTFLWPLLDAMPWLPVTAVDLSERRVRDIDAVRRGGVQRLSAVQADAESLPLPDHAFDVVTALEVLEHVQDPARAAAELTRVTRRFILITVPSKPDDNPEHLRLFTADSLRRLMLDAGAAKVSVDGVLNHLVAIAHLE